MTRRSVNYIVEAAAKRAGLHSVHPHMLRHSCGFYLADQGYDLRLIQDYLGHRDPETHRALHPGGWEPLHRSVGGILRPKCSQMTVSL